MLEKFILKTFILLLAAFEVCHHAPKPTWHIPKSSPVDSGVCLGIDEYMVAIATKRPSFTKTWKAVKADILKWWLLKVREIYPKVTSRCPGCVLCFRLIQGKYT